ncbi:carboxypeptidase M32 [Pseudaestuariivita sp.]|uniref:carboxypeptidase M32 n=1 Tax=Pseudaestuariivita sp. TaxID=2211669 RepID=UPI004059BD68
MAQRETYDGLMAYQRETEALGQIAGRLGWDQETMMPRGAAAQRSEEMAAIEGVLHARRSSLEVGEALAALDGAELGAVEAAQVAQIRKGFHRARKVPAALASEIAKVTSIAQGQWAEARAADDFAAFAPVLETVVSLKRQEAEALAEGRPVYDALLDDFEPDMTAAQLEEMFAAMRPELVELRAMALDGPAPAPLDGVWDEAGQLKVSEQLALTFGYDMGRGRIDKAVHPFSSGSGHDVRITTRTALEDPFNCFYSTIHEVGHAGYEQNIDAAYALTPLGRGVSMGVHESQSRIYENQLGRSRAFCGHLFGLMSETFSRAPSKNADAFYRTVNAVRKGYIRTEADELQYNLHVMLRFDLERAMLTGDLSVRDLETAWNDRFEADFGYPVDKASNGCLQDVHWSVGLIGYFPTYALGNVYAGCLYEALRAAVPGLEDDLARGETGLALAWLRENLQQFGGLRSPVETITHACGRAPSAEPLLGYLREKFTGLCA